MLHISTKEHQESSMMAAVVNSLDLEEFLGHTSTPGSFGVNQCLKVGKISKDIKES